MTYTNGSEKSSRSKADYFEVLVARDIARQFGLKKDFKAEIFSLKSQIIRDYEDGAYRIKEQEYRADIVSKHLPDFLKREGVTDVREVVWIGRFHQIENTLSDVDLKLGNGKIIGISLKSGGKNTQKNLGYESIKTFLGIDIDKELKDMWEKIREELKKSPDLRIKQLAVATQTEIKNSKRKYLVLSTVGRKYGYPVQLHSIEQSVVGFNSLTDERKSEFLQTIFGIEKGRRLLNVIAEGSKPSIYWNKVYEAVASGKGCRAEKLTNKSYIIYNDESRVIRVQASFTNGIGLSAFCQRAFLK